VAGWALLRRTRDCSVAEAAEAMGVTHSALEVTLSRYRKKGNPRAVPGRDTRLKPKRAANGGEAAGTAAGWSRPQYFDPDTRDEGEEA